MPNYTFADLANDLLQQGPNTAGWTAVIAVRADYLNALLGSISSDDLGGNRFGGRYTSPRGEAVYFEMGVSAPFLTFDGATDAKTALAYSVLDGGGGIVVTDAGTGAPKYAIHLTDMPLVYSGQCAMSAVKTSIPAGGQGKAVLDLSDGDWSVNLGGLTAISEALRDLGGSAVSNFVREFGQIPLGTVNANIDGNNALLVPKVFEVVFQKNPRGNDGCAVFYVHSSDDPPAAAPLPVYPLSDDVQFTVTIGTETFAELLKFSGETHLANWGMKMTTGGVNAQDDPRRKAYATWGGIDLGVMSYDDPNKTSWGVDLTIQSSNPDDDEASMGIPFVSAQQGGNYLNFSFIPNNRSISVEWRPVFTQYFREYYWDSHDDGEFKCDLFIDYDMEATISLDGSTIKITPTSPSILASISNLQTVVSGWFNPDPGDMAGAIIDFLNSTLRPALAAALAQLQFDGVEPFALDCIVLSKIGGGVLTQVAAPTDLLIGGETLAVLAVSPAVSGLAAGDSVTLDVSCGSDTTMSNLTASPSVIKSPYYVSEAGRVETLSDTQIRFTASDVLPVGTLVQLKVTANVDGQQDPVTGFAEVTVTQSSARATPRILPGAATVASGQRMPVDVVNPDGSLVDSVDVDDFFVDSDDTDDYGQIVRCEDTSEARFLYVAPTVSSKVTISVSYEGDVSPAPAMWFVAPVADDFRIETASPTDTVAEAQRLELSLYEGQNADALDPSLYNWYCYTASGPAGSVDVTQDGNARKCFFTAPSLPPNTNAATVTIVAFADVDEMMVATVDVTVAVAARPAPWQMLDDNATSRAIAADADALYQRHDDGTIWRYTEPPVTGWLMLDSNPETIQIVAAGGNLYQLHSDGTIWRYTSPPLTGWLMLDDNPATVQIAAAGDNFYQLHKDGSVWRYTGTPLTGWVMLDDNPATVQIAAGGDNLYQRRDDGSIWVYTGSG